MPMFISPMLPEHTQNPFADDSYIFEPKMAGHRLILSRDAKETRLWTRHMEECTRQYPELHHVPIEGDDLVLDGEVCCINPDTGHLESGLVMERLQLKKKKRIDAFAARRPVHYAVWDILFYKGRDLRSLPLVKRRSILESALETNDHFITVPQTDGSADRLIVTLKDKAIEGIVAKKKDSPYVSRRSHDWLKIAID
ncbi:ATP-dependent DNA ligase [Paenibacillus allorhizosphaerae]|nr:hypothetical protein [Paenibacillus allorhizosphaerae]